jgi:antitoxin ParD1/3/4
MKATPSGVMRVMDDWHLKRELREEDIERLRQFWDEGVASGSAVPLDFQELRREAHRRLELLMEKLPSNRAE